MDLAKYGLNPKRIERFDSSMLSDFMECPSKFYLRHVLGLKPRTDLGNPTLQWGTKWHDLQYAWGHNREMSDEEAMEVLEPWPSGLSLESDRYCRTQERMVLLWNQYKERFVEQDNKFVEVLRHEQFFDITCEDGDDCPYGGCGIRWCGRIDEIVRNQGNIGPWDFKTTGSLNYRTYWDRYQHGVQIPGYTWAVSHLVGEEVRHAYLDVMHVVKTTEEFVRRRFQYVPEYMADWIQNTKRVIARAEHLLDNYLDEPDAWEQNRGACPGYSLCQFADAHFTPNFGGSTRWEILAQDYVEDRWKPEEI